MKSFDLLFEQFSTCKVGIIGDVMLDTYMWGHVDRISPEAPVPVVLLERKELRMGGAGNVALNIEALKGQAYVISVTGVDAEAAALKQLFRLNHIAADYMVESAERVTTNKTRIISRNQQMMRLDAEVLHDLSSSEEEMLIAAFENFITSEQPQVVIMQDYNKGVLTKTVIQRVTRLCKEHQIVIAVDPKRKNFFEYKGVDIFKPNLKEVREGLNLLSNEVSLSQLQNIHRQLQAVLQHHISLITLSERGIFYQEDAEACLFPSHLRNIADVSGAGDTVIAVAALIYAVTKDKALMAQVANIAGGLVCEEVGTAAVNRQKLLAECKMLLS